MKRILILSVCVVAWLITQAATTHTSYKNSTFHTTSTILVDADLATCSEMIDRFILDFQTQPEHLFTWAFKGTGQTHCDDGTDDVVLVMNSTYYNPDSAKSIINADFYMPNGFAIRNKNLMSYVYDSHPTEYQRKIDVDIYYSGMLLKKAYGTFILDSISPTKTQIELNIHIRFGWFFNIFITQRRYRDVIEWRATQFIDNLRCEAEGIPY